MVTPISIRAVLLVLLLWPLGVHGEGHSGCAGWGVADPVEDDGHNGCSGGGGATQEDPEQGDGEELVLHEATMAVRFSFRNHGDCVSKLSLKSAQAGASVHLENGLSLPEYCRRLFPAGIHGDIRATLQVTFHFRNRERCERQLGAGIAEAGGVPEIPGGKSAEEFCGALYPPAEAGKADEKKKNTKTNGHSGPEWAAPNGHDDKTGGTQDAGGGGNGSCYVERRCTDLIIPNGAYAVGACGAVCGRLQCVNGQLQSAAGSCAGGGTAGCPYGGRHGLRWCDGDPVPR